jgi:hypothetical protein
MIIESEDNNNRKKKAKASEEEEEQQQQRHCSDRCDNKNHLTVQQNPAEISPNSPLTAQQSHMSGLCNALQATPQNNNTRAHR